VARACASSSLIPAVNKLGTVPLMIATSEDVKARYLAPVARGEAMFSYALSEPEAGSDAAAMKTKAVRIDSGYVLNGVKRWITNAGVSKYYTVMAVTDPSAGANGISAFVLEDGDPGFTFGAPEHKLGIKGSPTRELYFDDCAIPADRLIGAEGEGFKVALRTLDHVRERKQFGQPVADFQGLQFMIADMAMKLEAARQFTYAAAARSERAMAGEKIDDQGLAPRRPDPRRRRTDDHGRVAERTGGLGHGRVFGVVSVPDIRELAVGSRPRLAA